MGMGICKNVSRMSILFTFFKHAIKGLTFNIKLK